MGHFGLTPKQDEKRAKFSMENVRNAVASNDNCGYDMTLRGAAELNETIKLAPNTYYYSYTTATTEKGGLCGRQQPMDSLNPIFSISSTMISMTEGFTIDGIKIEGNWAVNDGIVPLASALYPTVDAETATDYEEAVAGVKAIMEDKQFGSAGDKLVIEEFMTGPEVSVLAFCDGNIIKTMTSAQDHKRAKDGDQGLNTGGMGTFSPTPFYTEEVDAFCKKYIYQPTMDAMKAEGRPFVGVLFVGLMLTPNGPRVLEYNARFGDPETQVVLPRMENDIVDVFEACIDGKLDTIDLKFADNAAVCVVLASDGYPEHYEKGFPIEGLDTFKTKDGYYVFHAGTKFDNGKVVTNGGRVLGVVAVGDDLKGARANAYAATEWISFANKYKRNDIGKAIDSVQ